MINIPFYSNLKDDTHCFQACLKMLLKHTFPKRNNSFKYLDEATFHIRGRWTWNSGAILFLSKLGFSIINIENFDYKQFVEFGNDYLKMIWPKHVFDKQKEYSDFNQERKLAKKLIKNKSIKHYRRWVIMKDIENLFKKGYLIMTSVNLCVMKGKKGYANHLVLITDLDSKNITFHDPGLPPFKDKKVTKKIFKKAMTSPYKESASLIAVKLK